MEKSRRKTRASALRVMSYNIHQGLTVTKKSLEFSLLKEAIRSVRADVVLLQEVAGETGKKGDRLRFQLEELADQLWPYYAYQKNSVFSGGFHGNAILSRYPIVAWNEIDITVKPLDARGLLHAEIAIPEEEIFVHAMAIHLGLLQFERRQQITKVCKYIDQKLGRGSICLLGGDFNDWRQIVSTKLSRRLGMHEAHLSRHRQHARTFPSRFPMLRLDRIYYRGLKIQGARCLSGSHWPKLSDHLPLVAEFAL